MDFIFADNHFENKNHCRQGRVKGRGNPCGNATGAHNAHTVIGKIEFFGEKTGTDSAQMNSRAFAADGEIGAEGE